MNIGDIITLNIDEENVLEAIRKAQCHYFVDNLRKRHIIVAFDSKVRGYLGEIAIKKWLSDGGINRFYSNKMADDMYCDIDLEIISALGHRYTCEIKTSKIPDYTHNSMQRVINDCDIKIIKRNPDNTIYIDRDIYIQIYYGLLTRAHDNFLISRYNESKITINSPADEIYRTYEYWRYINNIYFVAWEERNNITRRLQNMRIDKRTYSIGFRTFYTCKLRDSIAPIVLINFLNNN